LGPYAVAYKQTSIFLGSYVGSPVVWQWDRIPGDIGCIGPEAVTDIGGAHVFVGDDNIWYFDGTRPIPIATGQVRQWFFDNSSASNRYRTIVKYDRQNNRVWFFYPSASSSGGCDSALVYHLVTKKWGRADQEIECAVSFITPGLTWDTLSSLGATWDTLPNVPWDSQSYQAGGRTLAVFNTSHELKALTGTSAGGSITTGDMGDDDGVAMLDQVRLRFLRSPTAASAQGSTKMNEGDSLVVASSVSALNDGKFDLRQSGRWHRVAFTMTGPWEASAIRPRFKQAGMR
jgi:hypothetical protein